MDEIDTCITQQGRKLYTRAPILGARKPVRVLWGLDLVNSYSRQIGMEKWRECKQTKNPDWKGLKRCLDPQLKEMLSDTPGKFFEIS